MEERAYIPHYQVRNHSVILYGIPDPPYDHKRTTTAKKYTGNMTASTAKRIRRTVDIMLQRSPLQTVWNPITQRVNTFRLTFVTLTISARRLIDPRDCYRFGLAKFLDWMRKTGSNTYIWKAELQARGQVHYHITTNTFIRYDYIKNRWNAIQRAAGWLNEYHAEKGHWSPNSTDIHAVSKVNRIDLYLAKYLAKSPGQGFGKGKVWGCSQDLQGARYFSDELSTTTEANLNAICQKGSTKVIKTDHCTIIDTPRPFAALSPTELAAYKVWRGW